jgi:4-hydroxyisophthalate hydroxylase
MNALRHRDVSAAIVGGGPIGLALAIDLGQRGIECVIVEPNVEPERIPKGQNLTQRTLEHFYFWNAEAQLRAARQIPTDYGIGGITAYETLFSGYHYDWLQRELVRSFYFRDNERLPQYATEGVLRRRLRELASVAGFFGWRARTIVQDATGVDVEIEACDGGEQRIIRAAYVAGCDGSNSIVRRRGGITQTRWDHDKHMVLLVFRSEQLHNLLARFPNKSFYKVLHPKLHGYWQFLGRVDLGSTFFFHAPISGPLHRRQTHLKTLLYRAIGAEFDITFEHIGFWDLRVAIADRYRNARIFIAGDAAHSHPPYGGYGINTGFEDAVNLAWKLGAVLQGWGDKRLLDSYEEERRPVFVSIAHDFIEKAIATDKRFLEVFDPTNDRIAFEEAWTARQIAARSEVDKFEPNYAGSSVVWGTPGAVSSALGVHDCAARPGHHLAPRRLGSGADVYETLGGDFTLLCFDARREVSEAFAQSARELSIPLKMVTDVDVSHRDFYRTSMILVRPDQFVGWVGADENSVDTKEVLARLVGRHVNASP